jgi:uncharacterized protein YdiU (UPF0061 family)
LARPVLAALAVLTVAAGALVSTRIHIRVGTFEFFAAKDDHDALATLTSYALARHYPDAVPLANDALTLLERVSDAQANLVARWLGVGFVHGVMNTDNSSISGETIDYGPCAFLDTYDPAKVFSSIDRGGRYAFGQQPRIAQWNLTRLAEALLPLLAKDEDEAVRLATARLEAFPAIFEAAHRRVLCAKLGLEHDADGVAKDLLERMASNEVDFTLFFRRLCAAALDSAADAEVAALFANPGAFHEWALRWRAALTKDPVTRSASMRRVNPAFIPRNHRVEEALAAAIQRDDYAPFEALQRVLARPFDDQPEAAHLAEPPPPGQEPYRTFCGT